MKIDLEFLKEASLLIKVDNYKEVKMGRYFEVPSISKEQLDKHLWDYGLSRYGKTTTLLSLTKFELRFIDKKIKKTRKIKNKSARFLVQ
jgi:hypothetical protein